MTAVGPAFPRDPSQACSYNVAVTVGATDVPASLLFHSNQIREIVVGTSGILYLQGGEDSAAVPFYVTAGQVLRRDIKLIGGEYNVQSPSYGTAVTGTQAVTNGSPTVTFNANRTFAKGDSITFSAQPGVVYFFSAAVSNTTTGTLTVDYSGTTAASTTATTVAAMSGTFGVTNGSASVPSTADQTAVLAAGSLVQFVSQPGVFYVVQSITTTTVTLTTPYTGTTTAAATGNLLGSASGSTAGLQLVASY